MVRFAFSRRALMPRRAGIATVTALSLGLSTLTLGCTPGPGSPSSSSGSLPTRGDVIAASIGVVAVAAVITTVVILDVHEHHTVKGCLIYGPNGLQIQETQDPNRTYTLEGISTNLKVGDLVRLHGNRGPKVRKGEIRTFKVTEIKKNYGACPALASSPSAPASHH